MNVIAFSYIFAAIEMYVIVGVLLDLLLFESWFSSWRPSYVRALAWPLFLFAFVVCKLTILFKGYEKKE